MAEKKILFTKCRLLPNGCALDEEYNITLGAPEIDYYESIESPSISMTVRFIDIDQVLGRKGITGGELIEVTVKDGDEDEFKITKDHKMMLNAVTDMNTTSQSQEATLEFVSQETIINETARLNKKFTGNISQTVEDILTKDKKGIRYICETLGQPIYYIIGMKSTEDFKTLGADETRNVEGKYNHVNVFVVKIEHDKNKEGLPHE